MVLAFVHTSHVYQPFASTFGIDRISDTESQRNSAHWAVRDMSLTNFLVLVALVGSAHAAEFKFLGRRTTPGADINCNQKDYQGKPVTYCKICGGLSALADACTANPDCKGFDLEGNYCGYLKAASGPGALVYTEGFSNFCKVGAGSCPGDFTVQFRLDIPGNDLDCNAKDYKGNKLNYCKVMGDPTKVADACKANPACKAFTMVNNGEGYLKTATGPTSYMESGVVFTPSN